MSDQATKLVYMANQIARFFDSQRGDTAPLKVADHLNAFWTPTMRQALVDYVAHTEGKDLTPSSLEAVRLLRTSSSSKVEHALHRAGEHSVGHEAGDDAG